MKKTLLALLFLTGCSDLGGMKPAFMSTDIPGPPEYKLGWKDGCESGFATYGSALYKMQYSYYQNYSMLDDPQYVAAWHEAFDYCRHYNLKWLTQDN